jgi:hypothetical protein
MHRFQTILVSGKKNPYTSWTFLIIPADLAIDWGAGPEGSPRNHIGLRVPRNRVQWTRALDAYAFRTSSARCSRTIPKSPHWREKHDRN